MDTGAPSWSGEQFRDIDDTVTTLLRQLLRAVAGMVVAYCLARVIGRAIGLGDDAVGFVVNGLIFVILGCGALFVTSALPIRRAIQAQRRAIADYEAGLQEEGDRHEFASHLRDALEMAENEHDALRVTGRAMGIISARPTELLLADHSRSHLRRAVSSDRAEDAPGCSVESPWGCPAVRRGQTLEFASSETLGACPRLAARPSGPCSAVCVPVTVLGTPMGVIHTTAAVGERRTESEIALLEGLAMQTGSRVGILRAMARSEHQAATDPLTGQLNRRSFEEELRNARDDGRPFALVLADVDELKMLNDTFGHETGDRALRLLARTLREAVRDGDAVCRYGGDEFAVLFPACTIVEAAPIIHRAREALRRAVVAGDVPPFTASFGIADSTRFEDFDEVLRVADGAMFRAKQAGRDRLVIADEDLAEPHPARETS